MNESVLQTPQTWLAKIKMKSGLYFENPPIPVTLIEHFTAISPHASRDKLTSGHPRLLPTGRPAERERPADSGER